MAEPDGFEAEGRRFSWRTVDWRLWLARILVAGLAVWTLAGAIRTILTAYVLQGLFINGAGIFTPAAKQSPIAVAVMKADLVAEATAFRSWVLSAVILSFLVLRDRFKRPN